MSEDPNIWLYKELGIYSDDPIEDEKINQRLRDFLDSIGYQRPEIIIIGKIEMNYKNEICNHIKNNYPDIYLETKTLPKPFVGKSNIKAIVLGADPSNVAYDKRFEYVFGLENSDSQYFQGILKNFNELNLNLDNIYVQNVVQNYFNVETSKNKYWLDCAVLWLEYLKRELDEKFERDVPALATSWEILKVLIGKNAIKQFSPHFIYTQGKVFNKNENYLGRSIVCLFRHPRYRLKSEKWNDYVSLIKKFCVF